jgi:molybdopterin-guanine dinucleotide biosynthesis protein A
VAAAIDLRHITGVVLAGGAGSRMGSVDKGLQPFRGEPLAAHVVRRLAPQVGTLIVSANRNADRYAAFGAPVVADLGAAGAGPLAGLQAALRHCRTDYLVSVPCDAPFVPLDLVATLASAMDDDALDAARDTAVDVAFAATDVRTHPVFCLMRATVALSLDAYLASGGRAVHRWIATLRARAVSFADESAFRNFNTLDDLRDPPGA